MQEIFQSIKGIARIEESTSLLLQTKFVEVFFSNGYWLSIDQDKTSKPEKETFKVSVWDKEGRVVKNYNGGVFHWQTLDEVRELTSKVSRFKSRGN